MKPVTFLAALLGLAACDPQFSLPGSGDDSPPSQRERGEGDSSGGGMGY